MKTRRSTADSEAEPGSSHRPSATSVEMNAWPRRYTPLQSKAPDLLPAAPQLQPLELKPQPAPAQLQPQPPTPQTPLTPLSPHSPYYHYQNYQNYQHDSWRGSASTYQPPPSHRASAASAASHDGAGGKRGSRRGSRNSARATATATTTVDFDFDGGDEVFFPLSPAPVKKHDSAKSLLGKPKAARTTLPRGDDSEILPPDDRNYPVPAFRIASTSTLTSPGPLSGITMPPPTATGLPTATPVRIIHTSPSGPPSIYWSDDNASQAGTDSATIRTTATATNPSAFTFYREDPDDESDNENDGGDNNNNNNNDSSRQNRASRRFSRLSRITSSSVATRDHEKLERSERSERTEKRRSLREIGLAVARRRDSKAKDKDKETLETGRDKDKETGALDSDDDDDELEDSIDADGRRLEGRHTAEFEFVNGRYVPPALRNGRAPGRKPVNESRELERERERKRRQGGVGGGGNGSGNGSGQASAGGSIDAEIMVGSEHDDVGGLYTKAGARGSPSFWFVTGVVLFFVVAIAVGVGAGVGLSAKR